MKTSGITIETMCIYCGCAATVTKVTLRLLFDLLFTRADVLPSGGKLCNDCKGEGVNDATLDIS